MRSACASCATSGSKAVALTRVTRFSAIEDYAAQAAELDTAPRTSGTLAPGDIVLTGFWQADAVDGERVVHLLPTVPIAAGTTLYITRYPRTQPPTLDASVTNTFTLSRDVLRCRTLSVLFDTGDFDGLRLVDTVTETEMGKSPEGQRWVASPNLSDTIMVYTIAGSRGLSPLHAVGFFPSGGGSARPNYGTLPARCTVTLSQASVSVTAFAGHITPHFAQGALSASGTLLLPQEPRSIAERMFLNGGTDWTSLPGGALPNHAARTLPSPGAWCFTRYKLGSASTGYTEFDVMALRAAPAGTHMTFSPTAIELRQMRHTGTLAEEFTLMTPSDMAAGDVLSFRVGIDADGDSAVSVHRLKPMADPDDWSMHATLNAGYTLTAEDWTAVVMEGRADTYPDLIVTIACALRHNSDMPLTPAMVQAMPPACVLAWPAQGVLMPFARRKWSAAVLEELFRAVPQPGTTPLRIVR